jgi:hypothetical protein
VQVEDFKQRMVKEAGRLAVKLDLAGFLSYVLEYSPELRMWTNKDFMTGLLEASCVLNKPTVLVAVVKIAEKHQSDIYREHGCPLHFVLEHS